MKILYLRNSALLYHEFLGNARFSRKEMMKMENIEMMNIIHENCKKQRIINLQKNKEYKRSKLISKVLIFVSATAFFLALLILISAIENARF